MYTYMPYKLTFYKRYSLQSVKIGISNRVPIHVSVLFHIQQIPMLSHWIILIIVSSFQLLFQQRYLHFSPPGKVRGPGETSGWKCPRPSMGITKLNPNCQMG